MDEHPERDQGENRKVRDKRQSRETTVQQHYRRIVKVCITQASGHSEIYQFQHDVTSPVRKTSLFTGLTNKMAAGRAGNGCFSN